MADRVAPSVQASQDKRNDSVKHWESVQELYSGKLSLHFTLSGARSPFKKNDARAIPGNSPID